MPFPVVKGQNLSCERFHHNLCSKMLQTEVDHTELKKKKIWQFVNQICHKQAHSLLALSSILFDMWLLGLMILKV